MYLKSQSEKSPDVLSFFALGSGATVCSFHIHCDGSGGLQFRQGAITLRSEGVCVFSGSDFWFGLGDALRAYLRWIDCCNICEQGDNASRFALMKAATIAPILFLDVNFNNDPQDSQVR